MGWNRRISRMASWFVPLSAGIYFPVLRVGACSVPPPYSGGAVADCKRSLDTRSRRRWNRRFLFSRSVRFGPGGGVFSNEAGLGTLAVLHGAAEDTGPEEQGMWAMFEVFFDTNVICTLTALVILCVGGAPGLDGAALTSFCFTKILGSFGGILVSGSMAVFALLLS